MEKVIEFRKLLLFMCISVNLFCTELHDFAQAGRIKKVKEYFDNNPNVDVDHKSASGVTALQFAINRKNTEIARFLLQRGAKVDQQNEHEETLLFDAIRIGSEELANLLLDYGANIDHERYDGKTVLHMAYQDDNASLVKFLLNSGTKKHLGKLDENRLSNIHITQSKLNDNSENEDKNKALLTACEKYYPEVVKRLLKQGADVNYRKGAPLFIACKNGNIELFRKLLKYRADVTKCLPSLLFTASEKHESDILKMILNCDISVNSINSLFLHACKHGGPEVVQELLNHGADVNHQDVYGNTPLINACEGGRLSIIEKLLNCGADANHQAHDGSTPLLKLSGCSCAKAVQLLLDHGANLHCETKKGESFLYKAVGNIGVLQSLLDRGITFSSLFVEHLSANGIYLNSSRKLFVNQRDSDFDN